MIINLAGGGTDTSDATAAAADILSGKTAYLADGEKATGTMTNQGAKTAALNAGDSYTIPAGYHNGGGKVTANSLASQTSATAASANIESGKTAWVNGSKITGTLTVYSPVCFTFTPTANSLTFQDDRLKGKSAVVIVSSAGGYHTSTMVHVAIYSSVKNAVAAYAGYHANEENCITFDSTTGTLTIPNKISGDTIYNGFVSSAEYFVMAY